VGRRWLTLARGQETEAGIVDRTTFGIFLDVTGTRQVENGHELLAGEMNHRVTNLLAIAGGLTELTSCTAMVIHELAPNSVKHGALSSATGMLVISGKLDEDHFQLTWAETAVPRSLRRRPIAASV